MKFFFTLLLTMMMTLMNGQEKIVYQTPPAEILELVDIEMAPIVNINSKGDQMLLYYRNTFKTLNDLNQPELRLGGLRINPNLSISSTVSYYNNIGHKKIKDTEVSFLEGIPENPRISYISYSPDEKKVAFLNSSGKSTELWVAELETLKAHKIADDINANAGNPYSWFPQSEALLVRTLPENRAELVDGGKSLPDGPIVSTSDGQISQNRTYQDLLKNSVDETNFEILMTSVIHKVELNGVKTLWKDSGMYLNHVFSPDGNYVLVTTLAKPFSYTVPYYSFPNETDIYNSDGDFVLNFSKQPLLDNLPIGFMATHESKRSIHWRSDMPATLAWVEALDKGDPTVEVDYRDELFQIESPFIGAPESIMKTINRYAGVTWGDENYAVVYDRWWNTRNAKAYLFNPSVQINDARIVYDLNYQDVYSNPGTLQTKRNEFGRYTLHIDNNKVYLFGDGYTVSGQFPFIDELDLTTLETQRIYQSSSDGFKENIMSFIDINEGTVITRIESPSEYPNYYIRNIYNNKENIALTNFGNPFKTIEGVHKEVVNYKRDDGVELSGTLFLPVGYDLSKKEKLPLIMWAYPTEYKDKSSAGQNTANPNSFTFLSYGNPVYWVTRGYAVLDDASFPIVGEGDEQPNDSFVEQLVSNAKAAIDAIDNLGYIDTNKVAVGGHSYGAFMTANLLSHSDLFAAGISRSGAYNRTLTPFGFQAEERNYWNAPDVYNKMSPFMHADKMKTPMLLIHGEADNNSGTHTMQSERYFQALRSFGAPVRLVILPMESHGYVARENVLHLLWEQDQWLEKHVKNAER